MHTRFVSCVLADYFESVYKVVSCLDRFLPEPSLSAECVNKCLVTGYHSLQRNWVFITYRRIIRSGHLEWRPVSCLFLGVVEKGVCCCHIVVQVAHKHLIPISRLWMWVISLEVVLWGMIIVVETTVLSSFSRSQLWPVLLKQNNNCYIYVFIVDYKSNSI